DQGLPRIAEAAELDFLDIIPRQSAVGEVGRRIDVERRRAFDPGDAFTFEIRELFHADIACHPNGQVNGSAIVGYQHAKRLWSPVLAAELEGAFLSHEGA